MKLDSISVHAGSLKDAISGGVNSPIITSSAFNYVNQSDVKYPRYFNTPNQRAVSRKIAALEGAQAGKVFSSGMAAISTSMFAFLHTGDHVVLQRNLYGGTTYLVNRMFTQFGIQFSFVDPTPEAVAAACKPETRLIYIETPSNPMLHLVDVAAIASVARERGIITLIDNTFASPINQQPLSLGIDISIHSGTKYLGGHSDLCCGAVATSHRIMEEIQQASINLGGSLDAQSCYLLERSLKTLGLRVHRQNEVAGRLAAFLENHPRVARVYYPGLASHPQHELARQQMTGFGGMMAFELTPDAPDATRFQEALRMVKPAVSLGGVETTVCSPVQTSHAKLTPEEREAQGITERLLRISSGVEDPADLIADFTQALAR